MLKDRVVFENCQIGKGMKPLAQQGSVVIDEGVVSLLGTKGDVLDQAPTAECSAKRMWITGGQTVALTLAGRKYNATPGNGSPLGAVGLASLSGAAAMVKAISA